MGWKKAESIGWAGAFGCSIKIGYWLFAIQRGFPLLTRNVSGNALSLFFFVNTSRVKGTFMAYWGEIPHRPSGAR